MNKQLASLIVTLLIFPPMAFATPAISDKGTEPRAAASKVFEPITGAFGIQLGEKFDPSMVAKVLSKQAQSYEGRAGAKLKGSLIHVEPSKPDERFQSYSIKTTYDGLIYTIQGEYQYKVDPAQNRLAETRPQGKGMGKPGNNKPAGAMQTTCKATVKSIAGELESRYGKSRGKGWNGLWYTFRQPTETSNKGLKLYGHRCRTGQYSIVYTDEIARRGEPPVKAGKTAATGSLVNEGKDPLRNEN